MITVRIKGGLGNQLFQYATGYALSRQLETPLCFDPYLTKTMTNRTYKLPLLKLAYSNTVNRESLSKVVGLYKNRYINKGLRILHLGRLPLVKGLYYLETKDEYNVNLMHLWHKTIYLDGYFQSPSYFSEYRNELIMQITPRYDTGEQYEKYMRDIQSCNSVAIHVRRGDYKKDGNSFHYLLPLTYYNNAISYMRAKVSSPKFFCFSDDIDWVKNNLKADHQFEFVKLQTANPDIDEMMLMKGCAHIIAANSTFSWWAAWLNESKAALRIVPTQPYGPPDMIPSDWVKIGLK